MKDKKIRDSLKNDKNVRTSLKIYEKVNYIESSKKIYKKGMARKAEMLLWYAVSLSPKQIYLYISLSMFYMAINDKERYLFCQDKIKRLALAEGDEDYAYKIERDTKKDLHKYFGDSRKKIRIDLINDGYNVSKYADEDELLKRKKINY